LRQPPTPEFLGIGDGRLADWLTDQTTPHPLATYTQSAPPGRPESAAIPRAYISCTAGPTTSLIGPFAAKARALGWDVREVAAGHDAMLTGPDEVAESLRQVAESRG
jgi:hypothetical protein